MKYRLGDICTITKGETGIMKAIPGEYTMVALGEANKTHNEFQFDTKAAIIPLVSSTGHGHASMKRVKYQEGKFALGNILCAVIPKDENFVLAKYLHIYLHWNREELLVSQMKGMANVSLSIGKIAEVIVTVPSLEKQRQIVELEQKLVAKELVVEKLLTDQLTQLENLNQAILQEAVQGKLTAEFRRSHPELVEGSQSASELLKRIKSAKAKLGKKEKPLPPIKVAEIPFEIPESWVWCRLGDITLSMTNGIYKQDKFYNENGIGCLRMYNIKDGVINFNNLKRMILTPQELDTYSLQKNDILLNRVNSIELLGKAGLVNDLSEPLVFESKNIRVRFAETETLPSYLNYYMLTPFYKEPILKSFKKVTGQASISQEKLLPILIPLPPLSEQTRIVAEIEKQLAKTKQLKAHIISNQHATEQLLKALLHGAFEVQDMEEVNN